MIADFFVKDVLDKKIVLLAILTRARAQIMPTLKFAQTLGTSY